MGWLDAIGWLGSALLVYSVMQARVLRFRVLNLAACVVLTGYNAALGIWPMVAMNIALILINLWHVRALLSRTEAHPSGTSYRVVPVGIHDAYLDHVLALHADDIATYQPGAAFGRRTHAFLVQRGNETVGVVLMCVHEGRAEVLLDYVTPRYRDLSPGRYLWLRSGALADLGITSVTTSPSMVGAYYGKVGFSARPDGSYELALSPGSSPPP